MSAHTDWTSRKVQGVGDSSYRISIPAEFAADIEEIEYIHSGDFLIVRPEGYTEETVPAEVPFPDELRGVEDQEQFNSIVGNILQSLCIASVDVINVEFPDDLTDEEFQMYDYAWYQQQDYAPDSLRWSLENQQMEITGGIEFFTYINDVKQYLLRNLVMPLNKEGGQVFYDEDSFEDSPYGFGVHSPALDEKEGEIDTRWALATRNIGEKLYSLNRDEFARGICGIYIGKYLEMCIDIAKRLIESLATMEKLYPGISDDVRVHVRSLIGGGDDEDFQSLEDGVADAAEKSYSLNSTDEDFLEQHEEYIEDMRKLNGFREDPLQGVDAEVDVKAGMLYGQVLTFCERLRRFPRSLCHVGVGARNVHEVHQTAE